MVYCGKASEGCKNCRIRRIKCDKLKPHCTQCVRASKVCYGYRDQLSLLFRDESSKVIRKAHMQWGIEQGESVGGSSSAGGDDEHAGALAPLPPPPHASASTFASYPSPSSYSSSSSSATSSDSPGSTSSPSSSTTTTELAFWQHGGTRSDPTYTTEPLPYTGPPSKVTYTSQGGRRADIDLQSPSVVGSEPVLSSRVTPSLEEQGIQFYVSRYIMGHAAEPQSPTDAGSGWWIWAPSLQDAMSAVGLAGLANLRGSDPRMATLSRQKYTAALNQTASMIKKNDMTKSWATTRLVVLLAMYEVVNKASSEQSSVNTHIIGAAALMRGFLSPATSGPGAFRSMMQLCYSSFIPTFASKKPLPPFFFEWLSFCGRVPDPEDTPGLELATCIAGFIQWSASAHTHTLRDGTPTMTQVARSLLAFEQTLDLWESSLQGKWLYHIVVAPELDRRAVFDGRYHIYLDLWIARVWNYYRWTRIVVCQLILDFSKIYPITTASLQNPTPDSAYLETILRLARDTFYSIPSHWCHPQLPQKHIGLKNSGEDGSGSAGMPALLVHLRVAACAPGVPTDNWQWAFELMQCLWAEMGMAQARSNLDAMVLFKEEMQNIPSTHGADALRIRRIVASTLGYTT